MQHLLNEKASGKQKLPNLTLRDWDRQLQHGTGPPPLPEQWLLAATGATQVINNGSPDIDLTVMIINVTFKLLHDYPFLVFNPEAILKPLKRILCKFGLLCVWFFWSVLLCWFLFVCIFLNKIIAQ